MKRIKKPNGYWSFERCQKEALKYNTRKEFFLKNSGCYDKSIKQGWMEQICGHMVMGSVFWTKEKCQEESLKYKTRNEFRLNSLAYASSLRNKWLDEICSHMSEIRKPTGYWTKERCKEVAEKCDSKIEFNRKYRGAYLSSCKNNWLNEICSNMIGPNRKNKKWLIYSFIILDKYVYIGLTSDEKSRNHFHLTNKKSAVYQFTTENKIEKEKIKYKIEIDNIVDENLSASLEKFYLNSYLKKGYIKLNKNETGGLGGMILKWTKERCEDAAKSCKTRSEFSNKFEGAYSSSRKNKWLEEICFHMKPINRKPNNYWTKELCFDIAKNYKTKYEFEKKSKGAYKYALRNNLLRSVISNTWFIWCSITQVIPFILLIYTRVPHCVHEWIS